MHCPAAVKNSGTVHSLANKKHSKFMEKNLIHPVLRYIISLFKMYQIGK